MRGPVHLMQDSETVDFFSAAAACAPYFQRIILLKQVGENIFGQVDPELSVPEKT